MYIQLQVKTEVVCIEEEEEEMENDLELFIVRKSTDENESGGVAPLSPVTFSPATKILNASLSLNLQRQMKKEEKNRAKNMKNSTRRITRVSIPAERGYR